MVSWWPGDGNANDIQGSNTGALTGGATATATGKVAQCFSFNGSTGYVSLGNPATLKLAGAITIDAWINPSAGPGADQLAAIVTKWAQDPSTSATADSYGLWIVNRSGTLKLLSALHKATGAEPTVEGGVIPLNTWSHVAMTFDPSSGQYALYINGAQVATSTSAGNNLATDRNVAIGREESFQLRYFTGLIDEVEIFNRALSQSEIQSIFNADTAGKCKPGTPTPTPTATPSPTSTPSPTASPTPPATFGRFPTFDGRAFVGTGNAVLIVQFIIPGSAPGKILFRAFGPTEDCCGSAPLPDPILTLTDGTGAVIAFNDNWRDTQESEIQATGLAPTNNLESAILLTLPPGNYTAVERGKNDVTGKGSLWLTYSTPGGGFSAALARGQAGVTSGPSIVNLGTTFIFSNTSQQALLRALGPSLAGFGISGSLANPTLSFNDQSGNVFGNDEWQSGSSAGAVQSSGLAPSNPHESALVADFRFGYAGGVGASFGSAQLGIATFEIYTLPYSGSALNPAPAISTATAAPAPARFLNISTRLRVQAGENVGIGGFIITGSDMKKVIVRAIGPSLGAAGVAGSLQDPTLELRSGNGALIASNDNWRDTQQAEIQGTTIPPTDDRESAIVQTLSPGSYTAIVRGKGSAVGVALIETYDLNTSANSALANISTRGFVDTGDNTMIGGFILGGTTGSPRVVARAIGPSLSGAGISNFLPDPTLELHSSNGALIGFNDNWKDSQQSDLQGTGIPPTQDAESAIFTSLPATAYTVVMRGKNNTTGVGVVELYNLK
jgi:hypothetical protein